MATMAIPPSVARAVAGRAARRILVTSANETFRRRVLGSARWAGIASEEATGGAHALAKLGEITCDCVLLDRNLPDLDAAEVSAWIRQRHPDVRVEMVDSRAEHQADAQADGEASAAFKRIASKQGAADSALEEMGEQAREGTDEAHEVRFGREASEPEIQKGTGAFGPIGSWKSAQATIRHESVNFEKRDEALPGMIGTSRAMREVYRLARMVAERDTTVLVTGATGTGKELVAQGIHRLSKRAKLAFVAVNCAAIPEALLESELFGHVRGAYTGAVQSRIGRIHVAQGGTLFLDEVGELPLSMQAKLLRFLQSGEVQRLGSPDVHRVDVRVVCATNQDLPELARRKQFREDLYYRLAVFPIAMPALQERREDVLELVDHFLLQLAAGGEFPRKKLGQSAVEAVRRCAWNGNVRELQNAVERAFILSGDETVLEAEHFANCCCAGSDAGIADRVNGSAGASN